MSISDAVWDHVLSNAKQKDGKAFFSADHKNLVAGAEAKPGINGLANV